MQTGLNRMHSHFPGVQGHSYWMQNGSRPGVCHFPVTGSHFSMTVNHFSAAGNDFPVTGIDFLTAASHFFAAGNHFIPVVSPFPAVGGHFSMAGDDFHAKAQRRRGRRTSHGNHGRTRKRGTISRKGAEFAKNAVLGFASKGTETGIHTGGAEDRSKNSSRFGFAKLGFFVSAQLPAS